LALPCTFAAQGRARVLCGVKIVAHMQLQERDWEGIKNAFRTL
jgi:hypothetical protein